VLEISAGPFMALQLVMLSYYLMVCGLSNCQEGVTRDVLWCHWCGPSN